VFGDPLDSMGIKGVGSPEDTRAFLELLKDTGLNRTVAWWLNTHPRKEETREALNEIAGAWGGKPDTVFLLKLLDGDRTQVRQPKLRWAKRGKGPTLLFAFDPETETFTYVAEQAEDPKADRLGKLVNALAPAGEQWLTVREVKSAVHGGVWVEELLGDHPDLFELRTGLQAKALGRHPSSKLWGLRPEGVTVSWDACDTHDSHDTQGEG
jgi:hypothetical protein